MNFSVERKSRHNMSATMQNITYMYYIYYIYIYYITSFKLRTKIQF